MDISFKEKSLWISLIATLLLFGFYFIRAFSAIEDDRPYPAETLVIFISVVVFSIVVNIVLHIIISVSSKKARQDAQEGEDERDHLIGLKGTRNAHYILMTGVWITFLCMPILKTPFIMANVILLSFIVSEITGYITQLIYYRRGA